MKLVLRIKNIKTGSEEESVCDRVPLLIGRSRICDLVVQDPILSRQHCILEVVDEALYLADLESANGTTIDGKPIQRTKLQEGETFLIGETEITVVKSDLKEEESTYHELEPIQEETTAPKNLSGDNVEETKEASGKTVLQEVSKKIKEVSKKSKGKSITPAALQDNTTPSPYHSKEWVQVSLFWKGELINMSCFDKGDIVTIGKSGKNDFVVNFPSLPDRFKFLKIAPQGVEMHLHFSMKGEVETRGGVKTIEELRTMARQTDLGLSTFIPFTDRCLIEVGPFAIFIRTVRLTLRAPLTAPLIREPFFMGITSAVTAFMVMFLFALSFLPQAEADPDKDEEKKPIVKLESPQEVAKVPPPPKVVPKPKPQVKPRAKPKKIADKKVKAVKQSGGGGAGAKASGPKGKRGNVKGKVKSDSRPVGFKTKKSPPRRVKPKGAFGKTKERKLARRGLRKSEGGGTGSKKSPRAAQQAPSPKPKPKVRVEDTGVLGVIGSQGGGGTSGSGGVLEGSGLGGELEGGIEGLSQGGAVDSQGSGGRGSSGRSYGGGGNSLNVGGVGTKGKGGGSSGFGLGSSGKKGTSEVNYVIEDVEVRDGLTREEIRRVVESNQSQIQACWDKYIIDQGASRLSVTMTIDWFVNAAGRAINIQRKSSGHGGLYSCISSRISRWRFPKPRGGSGAQVRWPWTFNH